MKKRILLIALIGLSFGTKAQNTFPTTGNVGIGTTSPGDVLHVSKTAAATRLRVGNNSAYDAFVYFNGNSDWSVGMDYSNSNAFTIGNSSILGTNTKFVIGTDGNVGIGTINPSAKLEVKLGLQSIKFSGRDTYIDSSEDPTNANIYTSQDGVGDFNRLSGNLILQARTQGTIYRDIIFAGGLANGKALMTILGEGMVGIGTTTPDSKLSVNGKIHAKEVKVDLTGWPDYVFASTYKLPTLKEVEKHINQKGHLKDIPSAKDVTKNGILLGEMNKKLLQKIEELTLYAIQQEKKIESLEVLKKKIKRSKENDKKMLSIIQKLEKRIQKLEK